MSPVRLTRTFLVPVVLLAACVSPPVEATPEPPLRDSGRHVPLPRVNEDCCEVRVSICDELAAITPAQAGAGDLPAPWQVIPETDPDPELEALHGELLGMIDGYTIRVWTEDMTFTVLHEVGHVLDERCLGMAGRGEWTVYRDLTPPWTGDDWYSSPDEDWADSWAFCVTGDAAEWTVDGNPPDSEGCGLAQALISR